MVDDTQFPAPDVALLSEDGNELALTSLHGAPVVLFFYPRDNTPGCTTEAKDFSAELSAFKALGVQVFGVSKDSLASHEKFRLKQALSVHPNFVQGLSNLGAALNKRKRFDEAMPHLKHAINLEPEFAVAYFNLGNSYFGMKQFADAEKAFNTARQQGVDFLSLHWKLHAIYLDSGRKDKAIRELELILEIDPLDQEAADKLATLKKKAL